MKVVNYMETFYSCISKSKKIIFSVFFIACLFAISSCSNRKSDKYYNNLNIVINELMSSNRTGLQKDNKNPVNWIELKNNEKDSIDLEGFKLVVTKETDKEVNDSSKNKEVKTAEWTFPSVKIGGGQCMVVIADKIKDSQKGGSLQADLKLPKSGGSIQFIAPNGSVLSQVNYADLEPDQALALQPDSTYKPTYWQSPGFENTREGYESAILEIDGQRNGPILIWELMSRAPHSYENWVELKNVSDKPVELSGYKIAKKMGKDEEWALPEKTLDPGQIISFKLVGGKANLNTGTQAPFKLGDPETIVLTKDGKFIDGVCGKLSQYGGSIGRKNNEKGFFFFSVPTQNSENGSDGCRFIAEKPEWNKKPGIYKKNDKIILKLKETGRPVHYTLDGSEPTHSSPVFKDSIVLTQPTVVRSFAAGDSVTMPSNIATATYLLGVEHSLPVINISLDREDLYNFNTGIYANGPGYGEESPHSGANFWKNWTKKAYMEMFDDQGGFESDCGFKIFGGYSRQLPKKSFRIKFRGQFGDAKVNYDFFGNGQPLDFEDLVLRSGSQDYKNNMIKDEFFTSLTQSGSPSLLTQMYRPVALYINAEYFGLYYLREKVDKNFVARKLNESNDSIDVTLSGPSHYRNLVNKIGSMDMRNNENFEFARKNIDFQGLIDYKIGNIFAGKTDVGNIRHVRSRNPGNDRKWRFVFYDIDYSWSASGKPSASMYLSTAPGAIVPEKIFHNVLIDRLLKNKEFRQLFLERLSYHLTNTYAANNTTAYFDKFIETIRPEMKLNCKRWPELSYERWEKNIEAFRSRFENRPKTVLNDLRQYLSITEEENKKYFSHLGY